MNKSDSMAKVRSAGTSIELIVRKCLFNLGYRYSLKNDDLPGKPDIVLPKYNTVIFVHGCFWHQHDCKKGRTLPKTNSNFWIDKLNKNKERDFKNKLLLENSGRKVIVIWECQTKEQKSLKSMILRLLPKK